jgi:hypothetical protein
LGPVRNRYTVGLPVLVPVRGISSPSGTLSAAEPGSKTRTMLRMRMGTAHTHFMDGTSAGEEMNHSVSLSDHGSVAMLLCLAKV